jgi:protein-disulfide isomerase
MSTAPIRLAGGFLLALAGALVLSHPAPAAAQNWNGEAEASAHGVLVGRPDADLTMIEFFSYTCPHCGTFARAGHPALQLAYVGPGKVRMEYRPMIHDPVDLTVALMVSCGGAEEFRHRHSLAFARQEDWLARARAATSGERAIWGRGGTDPSARRSIASSLGLYDLFAGRGPDRAALDRCLSDQASAEELMRGAEETRAEFGRIGTPSFAIGGELVEGVHDWQALQPRLDEALAAGAGTD